MGYFHINNCELNFTEKQGLGRGGGGCWGEERIEKKDMHDCDNKHVFFLLN